MTLFRLRQRISVLLLMTGVALMATGCNATNAGTAAIVRDSSGERRITIDQVQSTTAEVSVFTRQLAVLQGEPAPANAVDPREVLGQLMVDPALAQALAANGAGVSDDDIRAELTQQVDLIGRQRQAAPGASAADITVQSAAAQKTIAGLSAPALDLFRSLVVRQSLNQQQQQGVNKNLQQWFATAQFTVNPRYGSFDPKQGFTVATPNWIIPAKTQQNFDPQQPQQQQQSPQAPEPSLPEPSNPAVSQ